MSLVISAYFTWCQHQYQLVLLHELDNKPKVPRPVKMDAIQVSLSFISTLSNYVHQHCTQILNTNMRGMQIANPAYSDASCRESLQRVHFHLIGALKHSILTFLHLCKIYPNKRLDFFHPSYTSARLYASSLPWDVWPLNPFPPPLQLRLSRGCRAVWVSRRRFPTWCMYPRGWYLRREL